MQVFKNIEELKKNIDSIEPGSVVRLEDGREFLVDIGVDGERFTMPVDEKWQPQTVEKKYKCEKCERRCIITFNEGLDEEPPHTCPFQEKPVLEPEWEELM